MKKFIIPFVFSFVSSNSFAFSEVNEFKVVSVRVDENGYGYIKFDKPLEGTPAECISGHVNHLSFDTNTPGGKGILSLALTAHSTGKKVIAKGTGTCEHYNVVEKWSRGWIID